ncbi:hypothetical protein NP233_g3641 [Leucocoprinus birnbaumii]|uniref:Uncharacterized protein n=1 Tax=Leucocoprinus birnbaumii TaxID=56174 RepID=A0AAD5VWV0_9AGAR|nr:hypothetical protein NP233_g3641 [Leucocoprinus birnbaumii]
MKFASIALPLFAFVTSVAAQASHIGYPTAGTRIRPGHPLSVQIVKDVCSFESTGRRAFADIQRWLSLWLRIACGGSIEVGLVLSLQTCTSAGNCPDPVDDLGFILYTGKWTQTGQNLGQGEIWDNITVTIPNETFTNPIPAQIVENRFHLIGAGPAAILETNTVAVQIV